MDTKRTCGTCTECCKTHPVDELRKRAGKWCRFRIQDKGCRIYEKRPAGCVAFECQWLKGHGEIRDRPDRTKIVIDFFKVELVGDAIVLFEGIVGMLESEYGRMLVAHYIAQGCPVLARHLSGRETLFVPNTFSIPRKTLETLANEKRRVLVVEAH